MIFLQMTDDPDEVCKRNPERTAPRIARFAGEDEGCTYYIMMEGRILCSSNAFAKAVSIWFVTHYIFNLQYCKQVKDVGLCFQESVFGLPEKSKARGAIYLTVTSDIAKYVV